MQGEYTAVVSRSPEGLYVATCAEIPGIVAEAETEEAAMADLRVAIAIAFEVNRQEAFEEAGPGAHCCAMLVDHTPTETEMSEADLADIDEPESIFA
jgi:predicted RNase H-like HicB family nuclease